MDLRPAEDDYGREGADFVCDEEAPDTAAQRVSDVYNRVLHIYDTEGLEGREKVRGDRRDR